MHEVSLAQEVLCIVEESAIKEKFINVVEIVISIGQLSGVEVDSFLFAMENIVPGTVMEGAKITITQPNATGKCNVCGSSFEPKSRFDNCPSCYTNNVEIVSGQQLQVIDLIVSTT